MGKRTVVAELSRAEEEPLVEVVPRVEELLRVEQALAVSNRVGSPRLAVVR